MEKHKTFTIFGVKSKIFFIAVLFFNVAVSHAQVSDVDIIIHGVIVKRKLVSIEYGLRNNTKTSLWLHNSGFSSIFHVDGNTIFVAPVAPPVLTYYSSGFGDVETIQIKPKSEINNLRFVREYNQISVIRKNGETEIRKYDFWATDSIDLTLILTRVDVKIPIADMDYRYFLADNAIIVQKRFSIKKHSKK